MDVEQRDAFGDYVEDTKRMEGRGGADNYTMDELRELADEFLGIEDGGMSP
jgi:hypothetical protein